MASSAPHLVRWKFAANTLLNPTDYETGWYHQIHQNKGEAVNHYVSLLKSDTDGLTVEIFRLTKLNPS